MLGPDDLQAALNAAPDAVLVVDGAGYIRFANTAIESLLGYPREAILGQRVDLLLPESARAQHAALRDGFLRAPRARPMGKGLRLAALRADGTPVPVDIALAPFEASDGPMVVCTLRDVSDRHALEDELRSESVAKAAQLEAVEAESRQQHALFELLMAHMPGTTAMFDREMRFLAVTPGWAESYEQEPSALIGRSYYELFPQMPERFRTLHQRGLAGESLSGQDDSFDRPDGRTEWVDWRVQPWRNAAGEIGGVLLFVTVTTERHLADDALRESEARFRAAFDSAPIGKALLAPDLRWIRVNQALGDILGLSMDELLATRIQDLAHPDDLNEDLGLTRDLLAGKRSHYHVEKRYRHKQGTVIWAVLSVTLVRDAHGEPLQFVAQIQDVTARRTAEAGLQERENLLRSVARAVPVAIGVFDSQDVIRFANAEFERLSGGDGPAEGQPAEAFLPPALHAITKMYRARARRGETTHLTAKVAVDGAPRHREITYVPFRDASGQIIGACGIGYDVTERIERDRALSASEARLSGVLTSMAEGLAVYSRDGRILDVNPAAERMLGRSRSELIGQHWKSVDRTAVDEDGAPLSDANKPVMYALRTDQPVRGQIVGARDPSGTMQWLSVSAQSLPALESGQGRTVVATFVDITEQRRLMQELRQARADLGAILDNVPARVTAWNLDYTNRFANRYAERAWGLPEGGATGRTAADILGPERYLRALPYIQAALGGVAQSHEQSDPQPDGTSNHSLATYIPKYRDGRVVGLYALGVDVTPLRKTQETLTATVSNLQTVTASLRESEHRLRTVADGVPMAIALFDMAGKIVFANDEIMRLAPDVRVVEGRLASEFFPEELHERGQAARARAMRGETVRFEIAAQKDGAPRVREITYAPYRRADGGIEGVLAVGYDVTELHQSRERIRDLAQRLASAREDEKVAISATLHEGIAQELFAAQLGLQQLAKGVANGAHVQALATEVAAALEHAVGRLRQVTNELVPISLTNLPITTTLRIHAEDFASRHAFALRFEMSGGIPDVSSDLRLLLFRTLQQGLANAQEHANPTVVTVTLGVGAHVLTLTIEDDGQGISTAATNKAGSYGVLLLSERYRAVGGDVVVHRGEHRGTVMTARIPIFALSRSPQTTTRTLT